LLRNSKESYSKEIDALTNSNLEFTSELAVKDIKLDELLAQLVEAKDRATVMEEMKAKVVTILRYASAGKMHELLHDDLSDGEDVKQARMLISQFSAGTSSHASPPGDKSRMIMEKRDSMDSADEDSKNRDIDVCSDDDVSSQRVFELESWAEALEEDNRCMELALISLETDMMELESHRVHLEDAIDRALNQLIKPTPGEPPLHPDNSNQESNKVVSVSVPLEQTPDFDLGGTPGLLTDIQRRDSSKLVSLAISKWLGAST